MAKEEEVRTSRIGKRPVPMAKGVTATISATKIDVKGPKGALSLVLPESIIVKQGEEGLEIASNAPGRDGARLQGLARALINNMVVGVTDGYTRELELIGTGYRAEVKGKDIVCNLGFSHQKILPIPTGLTVDIPKDSKGQKITLFGCDKAVVGQTAATLRSFRPPQPYGGKGVRYKGERVREKAGKAGK